VSYKEDIIELFNEVSKKLIDWGISEKIVSLKYIDRKRTAPTGAGSEFLMNRALGDWAENQVLNAFVSRFPEYLPTKYGNSDNIVAGDPKFKLFFQAYVKELEEFGKRPDILIFQKDKSEGISYDISNLETETLNDLVKKASYGIEVRSSKMKVKKYNDFKKHNKGSNSSRKELSITPKVEDLPLVVKWITTFGVPHYYFQVCLDEVYGISFRKILEFVLTSEKKGIVERNRNNAEKATIHVPFSKAMKIGEFKENVNFNLKIYEDDRGRTNPYAIPKDGKLEFDKEAVTTCLNDLPCSF
jgi:hypothetical protein